MKIAVIPIDIGAFGTNPKGLLKGLKDLEIRRQVETIMKIVQNTEESPGYFKRLADTQTLVKDYQLTLVWKTLKEL